MSGDSSGNVAPYPEYTSNQSLPPKPLSEELLFIRNKGDGGKTCITSFEVLIFRKKREYFSIRLLCNGKDRDGIFV